VSEELPVHIGREGLHSVEVPDSFEAEGPFDVRLINHGNALHVHLHIDDDLSTVARLDATNHYVESDAERVVRVDVAPDREADVFGRLKVVSAYGAETRWVDVDILTPEEDDEPVRVGEELSRPQPRPEPETGGLADRPAALVGAVGLAALLLAGVAAAVLGDPLVVAGALVVVGGVAVALALLR
jgi:hypothetical protein